MTNIGNNMGKNRNYSKCNANATEITEHMVECRNEKEIMFGLVERNRWHKDNNEG